MDVPELSNRGLFATSLPQDSGDSDNTGSEEAILCDHADLLR